MVSLNDEYVEKQKIYERQKEYRKTPGGKLALRRAKERHFLKKMNRIGMPVCNRCNNSEFEVLTITDKEILCYNCKYRRPKVLEECEICQ